MKHYFTRSAIYNNYRWFCLYIDYIGRNTSVLDINTGTLCIAKIYPFNSTIIPLNDLKINRWEI